MTVRRFVKPVEDFQKGLNPSLDLTVNRSGSEDDFFHAAGQSCRYTPLGPFGGNLNLLVKAKEVNNAYTGILDSWLKRPNGT